MPNSTGLLYNTPTGMNMETQIIVTCINDSLNVPVNIEIEVFKWDTTQFMRIPVGHDLFQLLPQATRSLIYGITNAAFYEIQSDFFSATSTIINVYGVDSTGQVIQESIAAQIKTSKKITIVVQLEVHEATYPYIKLTTDGSQALGSAGVCWKSLFYPPVNLNSK